MFYAVWSPYWNVSCAYLINPNFTVDVELSSSFSAHDTIVLSVVYDVKPLFLESTSTVRPAGILH